jgi:hypothetical protein
VVAHLWYVNQLLVRKLELCDQSFSINSCNIYRLICHPEGLQEELTVMCALLSLHISSELLKAIRPWQIINNLSKVIFQEQYMASSKLFHLGSAIRTTLVMLVMLLNCLSKCFPQLIASTKGHLECVSLLLDNGADANKAGVYVSCLNPMSASVIMYLT